MLSIPTQVVKLLTEVEENLNQLNAEWEKTKSAIASPSLIHMLKKDDVIISKSWLERLNSQCEQTNQLIPQINTASHGLGDIMNQVVVLNDDCQQLRAERDNLTTEVTHWKAQLNEAVNQAQKDKQVSLNLQMDVQELTTQLCDQSEFCSGLGSTLASVIWRLSRQEDAVDSIVHGPKLLDLLTLTKTCIQSFQAAYKDDQWPEQTSDEANFILALTGIFTNLAASAVGREQLATRSEGLDLVNTFLAFLSESPSTQTTHVKSLMLTSLYNLSINQKGVKYLSNQPQLLPKLMAILQHRVAEHQALTLRLLTSLIAEEEGLSNILLQLKESLPKGCLENLASGSDDEVKELALELLSDLRHASCAEP